MANLLQGTQPRICEEVITLYSQYDHMIVGSTERERSLPSQISTMESRNVKHIGLSQQGMGWLVAKVILVLCARDSLKFLQPGPEGAKSPDDL